MCRTKTRPAMSVTLLVTLAAFLVANFECVMSEHSAICFGEIWSLQCPLNETLLLSSAEYGRKESSRCMTVTNDFVGCTNNVLPLLDRWCSGRRECFVVTPNAHLEKSNANCLAASIKHLDVTYTCVPVVNECDGNKPNKLSTTHGLISSEVSKEGGCGTMRSPWVIVASPGQMINISMIDFSVDQHAQGMVTCEHVYGYILERALGINHTFCGGKQREGSLYFSETHDVELVINSVQLENHIFLIRFEVIGCADWTPPTNAWYRRAGDEAVIGCETDHQEWRLTCAGNTWHGSVGNCSATSVVKECDANTPNKLSTTYGLISSEVTKEGGCGTVRSPWVISASPGQTVNISMIDFSVDQDAQGMVTCKHVYGYILERALDSNHTICGGRKREGSLYYSITHNVEIVTNSAQLENHTFLIRFEVIGCADLTPPANAWYKRAGDEAVIGCETDHREWRLTCAGNTWHGSVGNCSPKPAALKYVSSEEQKDSKISVTVAFLAAITGGVFVLVVMAVVGVVYMNKIVLAAGSAREEDKHLYYRPE